METTQCHRFLFLLMMCEFATFACVAVAKLLLHRGYVQTPLKKAKIRLFFRDFSYYSIHVPIPILKVEKFSKPLCEIQDSPRKLRFLIVLHFHKIMANVRFASFTKCSIIIIHLFFSSNLFNGRTSVFLC